MEKDRRIVDWMETHREAFLEDLKTLCRIDSTAGPSEAGAPYGPGPKKVLEAAIKMCAGYGFHVTNHDDRVMTADMGPDETPMLDILAHLDVVGPGDGWDTDPFEPVVKPDGCIYGRGVADDKGGAVAALYAMRCAQELGIAMKGRCRLILGTDEESGSSDVAYYYDRVAPAPHTFTPDADFPVYNAEKGFYRLQFRKSWDVETATPRVGSLHGGFRMNVVPGQASAVIAGLDAMSLLAGATPLCAELGATCQAEETAEGTRLTVIARGCHAATPEVGINANTVLIRVLSELPLADCASTRAIQELNRLLPHGDWLGKALGIAQADDVTGALTCSFTQIDFTDTGLAGLCDCRVPVCATVENCKAVADGKLAALGYETAGMMVPPHYTPGDSDFVRTLNRCYETYSSRPGGCMSMGGGTYVHDVPGGVAFGVIMPGVDAQIHGANERIPVDDLITAAEIFAQSIADICG